MACIYVVTNIINGKRYVGQCSSDDPRNRLSYHFSKNNNNKKFREDIQRFGKQNFDLDILCFCAKNELNQFERQWIQTLNTVDCGYNVRLGGEQHNYLDTQNIISLYNEYKNISTVAKITKHKTTTIRNVLKSNGVEILSTTQVIRFKNKIDDEAIFKDYQRLKRIDLVRQIHHCGYKTVKRILHEHGIEDEEQNTSLQRVHPDLFSKKLAGIKIQAIKDGKITEYADIYEAADFIIKNNIAKTKNRDNVVASIKKCLIGIHKKMYKFIWKLV